MIISTSSNPAFYQRTVKMITEKNMFDCCTIVTAAHSSVLNYEDAVSMEDRVDYAKLKRDVKNWMCSNHQSQVIFLSILFTILNAYMKVIFSFKLNYYIFDFLGLLSSDIISANFH